jgi:hypothetical protein
VNVKVSKCWKVVPSILSLSAVIGLSQVSPTPPFKLTVAANRTPYVAGEKVFVGISQTNISNQTISCSGWWVGASNLTYKYDVRNSIGKQIAERPHASTAPGSFSTCELAPGQTQSGQYLLSWLFDLSEPGDYTVQVRRKVSNNSPEIVESNRITLEIVPSKSE